MGSRLFLLLLLPTILAAAWMIWLLVLDGRSRLSSTPKLGSTRVVASRDAVNCFSVRVLVLTSPVDPQEHAKRAAAIRETWGAGGVFHSTSSNACIHLGTTINDVPQPTVEDTTEWLKAVLAEFEAYPALSWLLKVEDTAVLFPNALVDFLARFNASEPLLLGNQLQTAWEPHHRYLSGAGFAVSREVVRRIRRGGGLALVPSNLQKIPDIGFSAISTKLGALFPDTRDTRGGERFNVFPPHVCAQGAYHQWYIDYKREAGQEPLSGAACCAADSLLFQYVGPKEQHTLPGLLYSGNARHSFRDTCPCLFDRWDPMVGKDTTVEQELLQKLQSNR